MVRGACSFFSSAWLTFSIEIRSFVDWGSTCFRAPLSYAACFHRSRGLVWHDLETGYFLWSKNSQKQPTEHALEPLDNTDIRHHSLRGFPRWHPRNRDHVLLDPVFVRNGKCHCCGNVSSFDWQRHGVLRSPPWWSPVDPKRSFSFCMIETMGYARLQMELFCDRTCLDIQVRDH